MVYNAPDLNNQFKANTGNWWKGLCLVGEREWGGEGGWGYWGKWYRERKMKKTKMLIVQTKVMKKWRRMFL